MNIQWQQQKVLLVGGRNYVFGCQAVHVQQVVGRTRLGHRKLDLRLARWRIQVQPAVLIGHGTDGRGEWLAVLVHVHHPQVVLDLVEERRIVVFGYELNQHPQGAVLHRRIWRVEHVHLVQEEVGRPLYGLFQLPCVRTPLLGLLHGGGHHAGKRILRHAGPVHLQLKLVLLGRNPLRDMSPGECLEREGESVRHPHLAVCPAGPPAYQHNVIKVACRRNQPFGNHLLWQYLLAAYVGYLAPRGHREQLGLVGVGERREPHHRRLERPPVHAQLRRASGGLGRNLSQFHLAHHGTAAVVHHHVRQPLRLASDLNVPLYPHLQLKLGAFLVVHMADLIHIVVAGLHALAHVPIPGMVHPALLELGHCWNGGARHGHGRRHGHPRQTGHIPTTPPRNIKG